MPNNILCSHIHSDPGSQLQLIHTKCHPCIKNMCFLSSQSLFALELTMTEFLPTNPLSISIPESPRFLFPYNSFLSPITRTPLNPNSHSPFTTNKTLFASLSSSSNGSRSGMPGPSRGYNFFSKELEFGDTKVKNEIGSVPFDDGLGLRELEDYGVDANGGGSRERENGLGEDEDLVQVQGGEDGAGAGAGDDVGLRKDDGKVEKFSGKVGFRRGKEVIRRSNLLAKQVISIRSALGLGFVSQLWVDTTSWMVLFVEVRPNLLSGDSEKFLLEDISQVGDVVLVQDESVIENEFKMVGLETLVGYKVVTPSQRNIGKVRGYTFSINSGAVEELELDSFGLSIIPSSLVSTYSLLVEDVLEVVSDAVVVHEAAASRIQRLSKGFLGNQNVGVSLDDVEDYDSEQSVTYGQVSRRRKTFGRKKPNRRHWDNEDDWDLPMDYL